MRPCTLRPSLEHRDAWLEVDLAAIAENARTLETLCSPNCHVAPVIKGNAYGHGAVPVARALADAGFDPLCVATLDEALELRAAGLRGRVILLYEPPLRALATAIAAGVEVTIASPEGVDAVLGVPAGCRARVAVQLKIDTGMSRQGLRFDALGQLAEKLRALAPSVTGVWTHLSDGADPVADQQLGRFDQSVAELQGLGIMAPRHSSGSAAIMCGRGTHYELVRPGLALFGIRPAEIDDRGQPVPVRLRSAMTVRARPVRIVTLPRGTRVGYGGTFTTTRTTRLATLPVGYADGLRRSLGAAQTSALCRSARAPIVGRISMDSCAVDVTDLENVTRGSVFTLVGEDSGNAITVEQLARAAGTIPQEILLGFDGRLPKVYRGSQR